MAQPGVSKVALRALVESVRANLNPHPAGQKQENVPVMDGHPVPGMQHKYRETVLFFPTEVTMTFVLQIFSRSKSLIADELFYRANSATPSARIASAGRNLLRSARTSNSNPRTLFG